MLKDTDLLESSSYIISQEEFIQATCVSVCVCMHSGFSLVWLFVTQWTVPTRLLFSLDFPGKNTGVGCHAFLQRIFLTQGSNLHLLH